MRYKIFSVILITLIISGCTKIKGEFAYKKLIEDKYKRADGLLEFDKNEKVNWVYVFKDLKDIYNINVTLLKKELVWVDIANRTEKISRSNNIIYGIIENLTDGTYKIIISHSDKLIDEKEFVIYSEQEEYYKYEND